MNDEPRAVYTHGHHESVLRAHQRRTAEDSAGYLLPYLKPGLSLLDVGCGPGTITADLAALVAPGPVTAVDQFADVLNVARAEIERSNLSNVSFAAADVHRLDCPDDVFDVVHAHQVLQHVADPVQALREMRRVCAPGGIVAARDADYSGFIWFPDFRRWISGETSTSRPPAPTAANRMPADGCCRGPLRRDSTTSRPPAASGATRRQRPANGGAECGPTGFFIRG